MTERLTNPDVSPAEFQENLRRWFSGTTSPEFRSRTIQTISEMYAKLLEIENQESVPDEEEE